MAEVGWASVLWVGGWGARALIASSLASIMRLYCAARPNCAAADFCLPLCTAAHRRSELELDQALLLKVVSRGGLLKYSLPALQQRAAYWRGAALGFTTAELRFMLHRAPRLLLYPVDRHAKYQLQLRFLTGRVVVCMGLGRGVRGLFGMAHCGSAAFH